MYKFSSQPWSTQAGRNLDELIKVELNAAVRDYHRASQSKFNQSTAMSRILRMDYFQVEHELDGAKPLVNLVGPDLQVEEQPLPKKKPLRKYPEVRVMEANSEVSFTSSLPRSKCAISPYFYGSVPGRFDRHGR